MANTYYCLVTAIGRAKLAQALAAGEQIELTSMSVGDGGGNVVTPSDQQTSLVREVYRSVTNRLAVSDSNPNRLILELLVPAAVGGFVVRECAVWDSDGDLFATGNFPPTYKPDPVEGATQDLIVRMAVEFSGVENVSLTVNTAVVIASRQWVLDNFLSAPGGTVGQMMRKRSNEDGDVEWFNLDIEGLNIQFDTVEEVQTLAENQTIINWQNIATLNTGYYVDGKRLLPDQDYTVTGPAQITLSNPFPDGSKIHGVQNDQAAGIPNASESVHGLARYASHEEALAGTANNRAMSPAKVKAAIDARSLLRQEQNLADVANKKAARINLGIDRFLPRAAAIFSGRLVFGEMANVYYNYSIPANSSLMEVWYDMVGGIFGFYQRQPASPSGDQLGHIDAIFGYGFQSIGSFYQGNRVSVRRYSGNGPSLVNAAISSVATSNPVIGTNRYSFYVPVAPSSLERSGVCFMQQCFKRTTHKVSTVIRYDTGRYMVNFMPGTFLEDMNVSMRSRYAVPTMVRHGAPTASAFVAGLENQDPTSMNDPLHWRSALLRVERLDDTVIDVAQAGAHFFEVE